MARKFAREALMKLLYEKDIAGEHHEESLLALIEEFQLIENDEKYIREILYSMDQKQSMIDIYIEKYAKEWTVDRMSKVDLAILRLAMFEILYREDIPYSVSINEAVELAKKYSSEKSSSFINGILGNFIKMESLEKNKGLENQ
jgi:N utilization substance protein B